MRQTLELPSRAEGDLWHYRNQGRTHAMHHHAELELNLVTRGEAAYLLANRRYTLRRGDLVWLFAGQAHVLLEQTLDFEMWIGVFTPRIVRRTATDPGAQVLRQSDPPGDFCRRLPPRAFRRLDATCAEVAGTRHQPGLFNAGLSYVLAGAWDAFSSAAALRVPDVHPGVEKAARLISEDAGTLRGSDLARRCGLSPSRLSRLFKVQTGVALADFRNRQRVERFLQLQQTRRQQKLIDAALEAGFGSYPQFHRVFKRVMGCSPRTFRAQEL